AFLPHSLAILIKKLGREWATAHPGTISFKNSIYLSNSRRCYSQPCTGTGRHGAAAGYKRVASKIYIQQRALSSFCQDLLIFLQGFINLIFTVNEIQRLEGLYCIEETFFKLRQILQ